MHLIETRDLCYVYPGNVTALDDINFIAPRNARIAVIGSNGAGKSTLFKHFNGIFKPTSGSVLDPRGTDHQTEHQGDAEICRHCLPEPG